MAPGLTAEPSSGVSEEQQKGNLAKITSSYEDTIVFYLNGSKVTLESVDPEITLLEYLRGIGLTGTKLGCAEGGCGACTVVVSQYNPTTKKIYHASVNACLAPVVSVDGKHVITVEGIGNSKNPHPVQERIAKWHGSQCGFCTPGIVMSLYALLRNTPEPSHHDVEEAFDGNLCRCTGYRPILDAAQTFSVDGCAKSTANGGGGCCMQNGDGDGERPAGCCMNKASISDDEPVKKFTPPGFKEFRPDQELIFPPSLTKHKFSPLAFGNRRKKWYRPVTIQQLLEIKSAYPGAKIIGGSTETQIEIKFKAMQYNASVFVGDIQELRQFKFEDDHVYIGANITLTDLELVCKQAAEHYGTVKAQPFAAMLKQLLYFAGRQIRNVGTPAGNLATASPISDLNPCFVASNTTLIAMTLEDGEIEIPMTQFFKGYRTTALPPNAIIAGLRVPLSSETGEVFQAFKQAKRKDDDIAIVNAAMRVKVGEESTVEQISLVYGGMAPFTVAAKKTMEYLEGKVWGDPEVLEGAMTALEGDFNLQFGVPGGMATYRRALAFGFFYKFWHESLVKLEIGTAEVDSEATEDITRKISAGSRDEDSTQAYEQRVLGKGVPHVAAMRQTVGEAQYTDDIPHRKNELFGCLVLSTKAHAKILGVDASRALDLPGVVRYIDHNDLPSPEANWWGAPNCDEVFFAVDEVFTAGQPIGMVLAESAIQAEAGARAVSVQYEELPAIYSLEEAIEKESFYNHIRAIKRGMEIEEALASADRVVEGTVRMGGQEHFYLETQACVAVPRLDDGEMEVFSSTQNPAEAQLYAAQITGVSASRIVVRVKRLGGGFGGKETRSVQLSSICALAAQKTNRPVRCMLNRDEDMLTSGQRHPFFARWKVGVNDDGKIVALDADVYNNAGWTQDMSGAVLDRALAHIDGCYNIPNVHVRGKVCRTNTVSNTAFRGFGGPQGMFIAETYMSEVADALGMSVDKLREINYYHEGDLTHFNQELEDYHIPIMTDAVKQECDYESRRAAVDEFNATHKWKKRGLALIPTKFGISFTALFMNQAGALVHIYQDGSVLVAHGGTEMGQGLHTKMTMVAAQALGVPLESVLISETATNTVANGSATAASVSSDLNGYAVFNACEQLNERLKPYREKLGPDAGMKELAHAAYFDRVNLSANGFYKTPRIGYTWGDNVGMMYFYFTQGVAAAEVEIDTLTGDWTAHRVDLKMDVGRSINPAIDYGQIEGAFVQGQGLFTTEESLWLRNGQMFTRGPGNYKIPGFRDIPQVFNVSMLKDVEWKKLQTIQRSRGVGEPPLFLGSSVFFAIRDALKAARKDHGVEDVLHLVSPATPERIRISAADPILKRAYVTQGEGEEPFFRVI
ncbi:xanthine dehydrogenase [Drechslerella stenobrocha 248]|uniref:xanthine dehydrogenase n=1 Tax=Drechslerella stenobrocha 248 TaxID=1043628 RepID=W7I8T0_9PEZI|nr:xanthine dehydrogenase [Drechslerella stenobrocha 248]